MLDCADVDQVSIKGDNYPNDYGSIANIQILAGDASEPSKLKAVNEEGDADYRLITGITPDKFYTVRNLTAGGTFFYRVKAHYIDDTWSVWSKAKTVTLVGDEHGYELGDVNHDHVVNVSDVTMLIANILGNNDEACPICSNVNGDEVINVADVTALISRVLNDSW